MALGAEVVDLIRLHLLDDPYPIVTVGKVAVVEHKARVTFVRVLVKVIDPAGIEAASAPLYSMHLVALLQEQLRQVAAILACYSCNKSFLSIDINSVRCQEGLLEFERELRQCTVSIKN